MANKSPITRRSFIKGTLAAAGGFFIVPSHVLGGPGRTPPSEMTTHAIIGVGSMGRGHIDYVKDDHRRKLLAVCDVDEHRLAAGLEKAGPGCKGYKDFRDVLDRGDIDVLHNVTPPHWHTLINIAAAQAGCDIWSEKPMTRTIAEGQHVIEAVQKNKRMFRLNTWFRFRDKFYGLDCEVKAIKKLVSNGLLGWPLTVRVSPATGFPWKASMWTGRTDLTPQPVPDYFDYDMWLGPAPVKLYHPHRTHSTFRGYWDYDGGGLADMGQHYLDPVQYILDKDETSPIEIQASAPWPTHPDAAGLWGTAEFRYADDCRIILDSGEWGEDSTAGKPYIEGPTGKIYRGFVTDPPDLKDAVATLPEPEPMVGDFNVSVKTRQKFALNEVNGNRSNLLVHLANAAIRTGRTLHFDPVSQRFVGDDQANLIADQPMRSPWHF